MVYGVVGIYVGNQLLGIFCCCTCLDRERAAAKKRERETEIIPSYN